VPSAADPWCGSRRHEACCYQYGKTWGADANAAWAVLAEGKKILQAPSKETGWRPKPWRRRDPTGGQAIDGSPRSLNPRRRRGSAPMQAALPRRNAAEILRLQPWGEVGEAKSLPSVPRVSGASQAPGRPGHDARRADTWAPCVRRTERPARGPSRRVLRVFGVSLCERDAHNAINGGRRGKENYFSRK
jgi:hypothetical protein